MISIACLSILSQGEKPREANSGAGTVVGRCTLPDSSHWDGITVIVIGQNTSTVTNSSGEFVLENILAGSVRLQAGKLFYGNAVKDTVLAAGDTLHVILALTTSVVDTFAGQATPELSTASTNVGNLGVPNRFVEQGDSGFTWFGQQQLNEGSLMIGVDTTRVSDAARFIFGIAQDNLDHDFQSRSDLVALTSGIDSTVYVTAFDDSRSNMPPGNPSQPLNVLVTQTTSTFSASGNSGFVLINLNIRNTGYLPLDNLLVGWFVDWNTGASAMTNRGGIVFPNQQIAGYNNDLPFPIEVAYQRRSTTTGPFTGIVPLSQARFKASRIASIRNEIVPTSPNGGLTEANKYRYMQDRRTSNAYSDFGVEEDLCTIVSVGGTHTDDYSTATFILLPAGEVQVGFAFVGGSDSLEMIQNALNAQMKWVLEGNPLSVIPCAWQLNRGWNMISLPVSVPDSSKNTLFPSAASYAFAYSRSHGYTTQDTLSCGVGYWLKFRTPQVVTLFGSIRRIDTIAVSPGWNIIGTLSFQAALGSMTTIPPNLVLTKFFGYDGNYHIAHMLEPMRGYWVKAGGAGKIILVAPAILYPNTMIH